MLTQLYQLLIISQCSKQLHFKRLKFWRIIGIMGSYNSNYLHAAKKKKKGEGRGKYKFNRLRNYQRFSFWSKINYVVIYFTIKKFSMGGWVWWTQNIMNLGSASRGSTSAQYDEGAKCTEYCNCAFSLPITKRDLSLRNLPPVICLDPFFQKKLKDDVTSLTSFKHLIWGYNLPTKLTLLNHHTSPGVPLQGWNSTRQINKSRKTRLGFHWLGGGGGVHLIRPWREELPEKWRSRKSAHKTNLCASILFFTSALLRRSKTSMWTVIYLVNLRKLIRSFTDEKWHLMNKDVRLPPLKVLLSQ